MQDNIPPSVNPADLSGMQNNTPFFDFHSILNQGNTASFDSYLNPSLSPTFKNPSKNYTSSEVGEQPSKLDERKRRRMISNRESAKRSRTRQQELLKELCSSVTQLQNENYQLINKLNHMEGCNGSILQENVRLKEEASILYQMLQNLQPENSHVAQNE